MNDDNVLRRSQRLYTPKFAGTADQYLGHDESVLLADDCNGEIFEVGGNMKYHHDLAVVLTDRRLILFRGRGMMGPKKPWIVELRHVEGTGVTRQGNTSIKSKDETGFPGLWKLVFQDEPMADLWMHSISHACETL